MGEYTFRELGKLDDDVSFSVEFKLTEYHSSSNWPPAAYVGFREGSNSDNSIQFLIIKNNPADEYVVAGYRVIESGKEVTIKPMAKLNLDETASIKLNFYKGIIDIDLDGTEPVQVKTNLNNVKPYISVSSGVAEFKIDT